METVCICCPIGCRLKVEKVKDEIVVTGNTCPRGKEYGISEFTLPKRVLTTSVVFTSFTLTLKTNIAIDKKLQKSALMQIKNIKEKDYNIGDVVIENILETGANVVVTGKLKNV